MKNLIEKYNNSQILNEIEDITNLYKISEKDKKNIEKDIDSHIKNYYPELKIYSSIYNIKTILLCRITTMLSTTQNIAGEIENIRQIINNELPADQSIYIQALDLIKRDNEIDMDLLTSNFEYIKTVVYPGISFGYDAIKNKNTETIKQYILKVKEYYLKLKAIDKSLENVEDIKYSLTSTI
jgi:glutamate synthase domain-containing protein 2